MYGYVIFIVLIVILMGLYFGIFGKKLNKDWGKVEESLKWQLVITGGIALIMGLSWIAPLMWLVLLIVILAAVWAILKARFSSASSFDVQDFFKDHGGKEYFWWIIFVLLLIVIVWSTGAWLD